MPKLKLLQEPEVVEFIGKRVAIAEAKAAKDEARRYKNIVRATKEAIKTSGLDGKTVKGLTAHIVTALAEHAPGAAATE